jgi:hypothetical protein
VPPPTTAVLFSASTPPAPPGNQLALPQTDGGQPAQLVSFVPQLATAAAAGVVRPDGTTITMDADGTIHSVGGSSGGGGGAPHQEVPAGPIDGSNLSYAISAAPIGGIVIYTRNGVQEDPASYAITGTVLTRTTPLQPASGTLAAEKHLITYWA